MKSNAALICNTAIESRHAYISKFLESTNINGWIVPTHKALKEEEADFSWTLGMKVFYTAFHGRTSATRNYSILGRLRNSDPLSRKAEPLASFIKITAPGPQFLYFLEEHILDPFGKNHETHDPISCRCAPSRKFSPFDPTKDDSNCHWMRNFTLFMNTFNCQRMQIKKGTLQLGVYVRDRSPGFAREMVWHHGVDKLVIDEN